ncbi:MULTISPECIES: FecR family protein [Sphingobacterium]|uniref:FecR family protein n=1 Tax=Sphingobacterium TaxID=28453 RepID=UPI0021A95AF0|nr:MULTISPECIES: FecR family protein [Sphingobacterium]MCT1523587.1 FecR domain-containing protein [Sphingobacterium hotanense]WKK58452.1 FecR domain-containing protein [Sphingobacterium sp. BN32]
MNQEQFRIAELVSRFLTDELSKDEFQELSNFRTKYPYLDKWFEQKDIKLGEVSRKLSAYKDFSHESHWNEIVVKQKEMGRERKRNNFRLWVVAASIILISTLALTVFLNNQSVRSASPMENAKAVISPGEDKALLILSDGTIVDLTNSKSDSLIDGEMKLSRSETTLDYQNSTRATNDNHTLKVPIGGTYKIVLADGTKVWMNSDSELIFPTAFVGEERRVRMKGEAFFEIAVDKAKPFRVEVGSTIIEALGTTFNVNTHLIENRTKTILTEGKIKVYSEGRHQLVDPGYATITGQGEILLKRADIEEALAWKDGYFYFDSKNLKEVLEEVARWYNVNLDIRSRLTTKRFKGGLKKSASIETVCAVLTDLTGYQFKIVDRSLIVK